MNEKLKLKLKLELNRTFCDTWEEIAYSVELNEPCEVCPFSNNCHPGHNGFQDYIEKKIMED